MSGPEGHGRRAPWRGSRARHVTTRLFRPSHVNIAIVGGAGTVGAETARELHERGHDVRVLSRHTREYLVDVTTGAVPARALTGVEVVVCLPVRGRHRGQRARDGSHRVVARAVAVAIVYPLEVVEVGARDETTPVCGHDVEGRRR